MNRSKDTGWRETARKEGGFFRMEFTMKENLRIISRMEQVGMGNVRVLEVFGWKCLQWTLPAKGKGTGGD